MEKGQSPAGQAEPVIVRRAALSDAAAFARICSESMGYPTSPEEAGERLRALLPEQGQCILAAEIKGEVVGYLHACDYQALYTPPMKDILGLAVSPDFRRRGIAAALMGEMERWAVETGAAAVRLVSGESRTGAHAFYRAQGYIGDKRQLNFKKPLIRK